MSVRGKVIAGAAILLAGAIGLAVLLDAGGWREVCQPVSSSEQDDDKSAAQLSARAAGAIATRNYAVANDILDLALSELGNSYQTELSSDDTGMVLSAAKDAAARHELQVAAQLKKSVLEARLVMSRKKAHIARGCASVFNRFIH
jgi:hypothetical protein